MDSELDPIAIVERPADDPEVDEIGDAWLTLRSRRQESDDYRDEWWGEQCGACVYFVPLQGLLGLDFGGCANRSSPFFARVQFEHDGCEHFVAKRETG